MKIAIHTI